MVVTAWNPSPDWVACFRLIVVLALGLSALMDAGWSQARGDEAFRTQVAPFLNTHCVRCHDAKNRRGELDLTRLTPGRILEDFRQWEHVVTFVRKGEMPPESARQPTAAQRSEFLKALEKVLQTEARKLAGDPGVVPPRRLSNAEYDNTIHDLTGVDIQPARSFPADPASGEGFTNTGEALTMSPSLFKKYYGAAEQVADHAMLTTAGLRFAPHPVITFADRQKYYEQQILRFYEAHAVDPAKYLSALWLYRETAPESRPATIEAWARDQKLSPIYARHLWDLLQSEEKDAFALSWLRARWKALPRPKTAGKPVVAEVEAAVRSLAMDCQRLSRELCPEETPAIVAHAGNAPIDHLERRRQTATRRDTFDSARLLQQTVKLEYGEWNQRRELPVIVELAGLGDARPEGALIVEGQFSTNSATTDGKKKWSLRQLVEQHLPEQFGTLRFGTHPQGARISPDAFVLVGGASRQPLQIRLPTKAIPLRGKGSVTLTLTCRLDRNSPGAMSVHITDRVDSRAEAPALPLITPGHPRQAAVEASAGAFCRVFPSRFFHVDATRGLSAGFHLIEGFFRDDQPLCRSVLTPAEKSELDRLWRELYFVTGIWEKLLRGFVFFERSERNFLKHADFDAFKEEDPDLVQDDTIARLAAVYLRRSGVKLEGSALEKHPISVFFTEIRQGLREHAEQRKQTEQLYRDDLLAFAARAYRRPLRAEERTALEAFYTRVCRDRAHGLETAVRSSLVRILVSPHFCLHYQPTPAGEGVAPLPDLALASRLSYFLWAGPPDEELLHLAQAGKLRDSATLRSQVRRMTRDPRVSRFALEFFGQWLGYRDFLTQEAVSRDSFPGFDDGLRQAMFEEPTRLVTHLVRSNSPLTELLNGDATFVNPRLAKHYGLSLAGDDWQRVTGLREKGRAGVMGMAVFLTRYSQPQRTSPVKRGFWMVHKVLGEHIPPPPPNVAVLPAKETDAQGKTIRELLRLHVEDANCARCHQRFDPIGLAMEGFDPIGRTRTRDLAGRPIDNRVTLPGGKEARGVPEFADHLVAQRQAEFARTLCHKFLGYALGRSLQLSDQPLLERMQSELARSGYRPACLFELVATSPQFLTQRCKDFSPTRFRADRSSRGEP
ncbi:MAG: DUF1592 domain-containing protein [Gemmataceae bacterium]